MQISIEKWKKLHSYQEKPGWCGPSVIQMALRATGVKKTQSEIAKDVFKDWWGTTQQIMLAYLSRFFKIVNYKNNSTFKDISFHLKKGHIVIVNWWDDLDKDDTAGGHYSIVADYDFKLKGLTLVDPSNGRPRVWTIADKEFNKKWYDTLDVHDRTWVEGFMLWIDPKSKI